MNNATTHVKRHEQPQSSGPKRAAPPIEPPPVHINLFEYERTAFTNIEGTRSRSAVSYLNDMTRHRSCPNDFPHAAGRGCTTTVIPKRAAVPSRQRRGRVAG